MTKTREEEFVFLPLGGANEIGINLNLYGLGSKKKKQWIIVDYGISFNDPKAPGMEALMADPEFLFKHKSDILAIVLTHAHEDHIGAVHHIWPYLKCPIYCTPFTAWLVRDRFKTAGLSEDSIYEIELGGRFQIGPFSLEYISLTHSIPEPNGVLIKTKSGCVLHTGDWKIDFTPQLGEAPNIDRLKALRQEAYLTLVCDSTNALSKGNSGSEKQVRETLIDLISNMTGAVAIASFASNLARLESCMIAAKQNNRKICIAGRSIKRMIKAAVETGLLSLNSYEILSEKDVLNFEKQQLLYLCTGSQGEARAALSKIAANHHRYIRLGEGDTVLFSSKIIPGNEIGIYQLHNQLAELGVKIITEKDHDIHVSGHAYRDELKQIYEWISPKHCIPVHGERRHLIEHAEFAKSLGIKSVLIPENGALIRLGKTIEKIDQFESGRIYRDGHLLLTSDCKTVSERRKLAWAGQLWVHIILNTNRTLLIDPVLRARGFPDAFEISYEDLMEHLIFFTKNLLRIDFSDDLSDLETAKIEIERALRRELNKIWGKKPLIDVVFSILK